MGSHRKATAQFVRLPENILSRGDILNKRKPTTWVKSTDVWDILPLGCQRGRPCGGKLCK